MFLFVGDAKRYQDQFKALGYTLEENEDNSKYTINGKIAASYDLYRTNRFEGLQPDISFDNKSGEVSISHSSNGASLDIDEYAKYLKDMQKLCDVLEDVSSDNFYIRKSILQNKGKKVAAARTVKINAAKRLKLAR